jgi:hypothetical protein
MNLYVVAGCLTFVFALILGMIAYLWWQSTIEPAPLGVMFEVRDVDPLRVSRVEEGRIIAVPIV